MTERSDAFVFFGATGDLAYKQIFPALQTLVARGQLEMPVIGVARPAWSREQLTARVRESLEHSGGVDREAFGKLIERLRYVDGDYADASTFARVREMLGGARRPLHYLAIPPSLFAPVVHGLARAGCADGARVVVEKPFGRDVASARQLNRTVHEVFPEPAVFRIDHYLGKEAVQNLVYFRFANSFLEPIWNREHIASVHITMAENFGVQGRGAFYDEVGAIRDVVQNHLLQVVALLAMEAPIGHDPAGVRAEKLRLLRAIRPLGPATVVRGQFDGYRDEPGVAPQSRTETFAALRFDLDTWRWAGVPFHVRTGKCLPLTATEVVVDLHRPPLPVFDTIAPEQSNMLRFRLGPEVVIALGARVKRPGEPMQGEPIELVARHLARSADPPYVRLLGDALDGDTALFNGDEAVEVAWQIVEPVLGDVTPVYSYAKGTWGPAAAARPIGDSEGWHDPAPEATEPC